MKNLAEKVFSVISSGVAGITFLYTFFVLLALFFVWRMYGYKEMVGDLKQGWLSFFSVILASCLAIWLIKKRKK